VKLFHGVPLSALVGQVTRLSGWQGRDPFGRFRRSPEPSLGVHSCLFGPVAFRPRVTPGLAC
jgi:hypothetical protein